MTLNKEFGRALTGLVWLIE